jgi:lipoyl(octanoyl) transferase
MPCIAARPSIFNRYVTESKECIVVWHGRVQFAQALDLQMKICELKKRGFDRDVLLLLEHPPTITLGRNASMTHLLAREDELASQGVVVCNVDRGGDITFHGPGQLVGYPILSLNPGERDVHRYMRNLEESLIDLLGYYGIPAGRDARFTGVWTDKGKIAAMGVHISRWITRHGFALNVNTDLSFYNMIVPCGIVGRGVTSMQKELSCGIDLAEVAARYIPRFASVFHRNMILMSPDALLENLTYPEAGDIQERAVV